MIAALILLCLTVLAVGVIGARSLCQGFERNWVPDDREVTR